MGVFAAALALLASGCGQVARLDNPMLLRDTDPETAEKVARRILTELRFEVEYPPARKGELATRPLTGASWFEFWREDTVGNDQRLEASLHTVRRRVALAVKPTEKGSEVFVKVVKERLSAPGTGPEDIGEAYSLYEYDDISELKRLEELDPSRFRWTGVDRDDRLEQRILWRIRKSLQLAAPNP
jgi:hypothetical protein